jgi:predicted site-specific integrase-resolvase
MMQRQAASPLAPRVSLQLLTADEVSNMLQIEPQTLAKWRCEGTGPEFIRVGRTIRYTIEAVRDFLAARTGKSTAQLDAAGVA